ncbi:MAG: hypothetical protein ACTSRH_07225 [Promethearchaeota archaeon]
MWKCFKVTFKICTPIHIGYLKIGTIKTTRYYIPGKNFWGALNVKITPLLMNPISDESYQKIGKFLKESIIFSYFFLKTNNLKLLKPKFSFERGLTFGGISKHEFEKRFIIGYPATAINPLLRSAEEGSLHEIELISPIDKKSNDFTFLEGLIFVKKVNNGEIQLNYTNNSNIQLETKLKKISINEVLEKGIQVGGERRYGSGLIKLSDIKTFQNGKYDLSGEKIKLNLKKNDFIESHLRANSSLNLKGEIEGLMGREWGKKGFGREKNVDFFLAWIPGSIILDDNVKLNLTHYGILEL